MLYSYYQIINKNNQKTYIGITQKQPEQRFKEHQKMLKNNHHVNYLLQEDWNKYGKEFFEFKVIEQKEYDDVEEAYNYEYILIKNFSGELYNLAPGGQINPMVSSVIKEKMIQTKQKAVPNVYQVEEIEENIFKIVRVFNSQKEIQRELGFNQGNIGRSIKKKSKSYGYFWINEEDIENNLQNWRPYRIKIRPTAKIEQGQIVEVHHNARSFEILYNLKPHSVSSSVLQNQKLFGVIYKYISEEEYYKIKPLKLIK